ncbi:MAG TPA: DUF5666 domain-containing protein [Candidatus Eisenbacteria bacterium]|nr:DUF5666 domain-containing protein [Candidatus Eisenbacteria bacterium]
MIKLPIAALIAAVALLGGFYGGYKTGQGGASSSGTAFAQTAGNAARSGAAGITFACPSPGASPSPGARAVRRGTTGVISSLTTNSFTVHDTRCNTDTKVTFDQSVIVRKTVDGQASDLQENQSVAVQGQRQADGSVKANTITIVPANSGFGGAAGTGG